MPQYRDPKIIKFDKRRKKPPVSTPPVSKPGASQPAGARVPVFTPRGRKVAIVIGVVLLIAGGVYVYELQRHATKFGSLDLAWRHMSASSSCDTARRAHLENARTGQPGYYPQHDADKDGVACEPVLRSR